MRLLFELSGEHPTLPAAEALAVLDLHGGAREVRREPGLLWVEAPGPLDVPAVAARLGLTHRICEPLDEAALDEEAILAAVRAAAPHIGPRFRVRAHRIGEPLRGLPVAALERNAGAALAEGRRVVLQGAADELRILLGERAHLGLLRAAVDRGGFDDRHVRNRPYFSPTALHPRFARALVNLARVKAGDRVADPFVGTGGILLEAALLGAKVVGWDVEPVAVEGARANLAHWAAPGEVWPGDAAEELLRAAPLDAIATDPPYGRASTTAREAPTALYARALTAMALALKPGGRAAVVFPDAAALKLAPAELALEQHLVQRVHRSLDRHYAVFRKSP